MNRLKKIGLGLLPLVLLLSVTATILAPLVSTKIAAYPGEIPSPALTVNLTGSVPSSIQVTARPISYDYHNIDDPEVYTLSRVSNTQYELEAFDFVVQSYSGASGLVPDQGILDNSFTFDVRVASGGSVLGTSRVEFFGPDQKTISIAVTSNPGSQGAVSGAIYCTERGGAPRIAERINGVITLRNNNNSFETSSLDNEGRFSFTGVPVGTYTLSGTASWGIAPNMCSNLFEEEVTVTAGQTAQIFVSGGEGQESTSSDTPPEGGSLDEEEGGDSCEDKAGSTGWIVCPVIYMMDGALNWMDTQIAALLEVDEEKYNNPGMKKAWGNIRNIAYVILIPIMLVMVIGTALGFEVFSAYTIKRALPRMVMAVIFITFSWYICIFMIGLFNVIGAGVLGLLTSPFEEGVGKLTLSKLFSGGVATSIIALPFAVAATIAVLAFFLPTIALFVITAFAILLTRQLFITALVLLAPVAILAWIFPGNDKLWKLWWNAFTKLLIMFPLIMALIAVGRIFAWILDQPDPEGVENIITPILKLLAYTIPYAAIPLTFKFAGGIFGNLAGMINDREKGLFDRARQRRHNKWERGTGLTGSAGLSKVGVLQARAGAHRGLMKAAGKRKGLSAYALRKAGGLAGGYNIEAAMSAQNAATAKELNDQIATGRDDEIRGLTVNKKAALAAGALGAADADGWMSNGLFRQNVDGRREFKSLGGAWVNEAYVDEGYKRWGKDHFAQQAALSYEMRKAMKEEDVKGISERYASLATDGWKMTDTEAGGAWIGAGFENQNQHLEFKNTSWKGVLDGKKFVDEVYEKKGTYQLSQMSSHTIERLKTAYNDAVSSGDVDTQMKVAAIAENFMHEYSTGRIGGSDDQPEFDSSGTPTGRRQASSQGPAHMAERVVELAKLVKADPRSNDTRSVYDRAPVIDPMSPTAAYDASHAPTPNRRELK